MTKLIVNVLYYSTAHYSFKKQQQTKCYINLFKLLATCYVMLHPTDMIKGFYTDASTAMRQEHCNIDRGWTKRIFRMACHGLFRLLENFNAGPGFIALSRYYATVSEATVHSTQHNGGNKEA
jgi:hypothetical protein